MLYDASLLGQDTSKLFTILKDDSRVLSFFFSMKLTKIVHTVAQYPGHEYKKSTLLSCSYHIFTEMTTKAHTRVLEKSHTATQLTVSSQLIVMQKLVLMRGAHTCFVILITNCFFNQLSNQPLQHDVCQLYQRMVSYKNLSQFK